MAGDARSGSRPCSSRMDQRFPGPGNSAGRVIEPFAGLGHHCFAAIALTSPSTLRARRSPCGLDKPHRCYRGTDRRITENRGSGKGIGRQSMFPRRFPRIALKCCSECWVTSGGTLPVADPPRGGYHVPTGDRTSDPGSGVQAVRLASAIIAGFLIFVSVRPSRRPNEGRSRLPQRDDAVRRHGLDPASPLESRVKDVPAAVLKMFEEAGEAAPTAHALTTAERRKLAAGFAALAPLHRRILGERLRSVSFLDGMPNTALSSTVNPDEPYMLFHITIRAGFLRENVSEWMTWKERTCFEVASSPLCVSVEAGELDAIIYVILHEATHIVDSCLQINAGRTIQRSTSRARSSRPEALQKASGASPRPLRPIPRSAAGRIRFRVARSPDPCNRPGLQESIYKALRVGRRSCRSRAAATGQMTWPNTSRCTT